MSDFFGGIYSGVRRPDVVMNDGPLPPLSIGAGYPAGFNGIPDGKIDYATSLLSDLDPYAYGEAARPGSQAAYQPIPHVAQRIIPSLDLPEAQPFNMGGSFFRLSHQVDDGDVAFVIRAMFSPYELVADKRRYNKQGRLYQVDPIVNLATVNYILHGLQRYGFDKVDHKCWNTLWIALGVDEHFGGTGNYEGRRFSEEMLETQREMEDANRKRAAKNPEDGLAFSMHHFRCTLKMRVMRRRLVDYLVKHVIKPFGIPRGSEKQGGQHQGSNAPVNWPVDFVTAVVIDGKVINLVNCWKHDDVSAGDDLIMYVEDRPYSEYVLSHHPKCMKKQVFPTLETWVLPASLAEASKEGFVCSAGEDLLKRIWDMLSSLEADADMAGGPSGVPRGRPKPKHLLKIDDGLLNAGGGGDRTVTSADLKRQWQQQELLAGKERAKRENKARRAAIEAEEEYDENDAPFRVPRRQYITADNKVLDNPDGAYNSLLMVLSTAESPDTILGYIGEVNRYTDQFRVSVAQAIVEVARKLEEDGILNRSYAAAHDTHLIGGVRGTLPKLNTRPVLVKESIFQLVPGVSSSHSTGVRHAIWRHGYWHIARSQIMHFKYDQHLEIPNGIHAAIRGKLLEAILAPVWVEALESDVLSGGGYGAENGPTEAFSGSGGHKRKRNPNSLIHPESDGHEKLNAIREACDECSEMMHRGVQMATLLQPPPGSNVVEVTRSMCAQGLQYAQQYQALSHRVHALHLDKLEFPKTGSERGDSMNKLLDSAREEMRLRLVTAAEDRVQKAARRGIPRTRGSRMRGLVAGGDKSSAPNFALGASMTSAGWVKNVKDGTEKRCELVLQYLALAFLGECKVESSILTKLMDRAIDYVEDSLEDQEQPCSLFYAPSDPKAAAKTCAVAIDTVTRMLLQMEINVPRFIAAELVGIDLGTDMRTIDDFSKDEGTGQVVPFNRDSFASHMFAEGLVKVVHDAARPIMNLSFSKIAGQRKEHLFAEHVFLQLATLPMTSSSEKMTMAQSMWAAICLAVFEVATDEPGVFILTTEKLKEHWNRAALCFLVAAEICEKGKKPLSEYKFVDFVKKCFRYNAEGKTEIPAYDVAELAESGYDASLFAGKRSFKADAIEVPNLSTTGIRDFVNDMEDKFKDAAAARGSSLPVMGGGSGGSSASGLVAPGSSLLSGEAGAAPGAPLSSPSATTATAAASNNPLIGSILLSASSEQLSSLQQQQQQDEGTAAGLGDDVEMRESASSSSSGTTPSSTRESGRGSGSSRSSLKKVNAKMIS